MCCVGDVGFGGYVGVLCFFRIVISVRTLQSVISFCVLCLMYFMCVICVVCVLFVLCAFFNFVLCIVFSSCCI